MTTTQLNIPGYKISHMLAQGGMAEVYLAEQLSLGRQVAIKVLDSHADDSEFAQRFLHEARLVAALSHTNLITIYDFGQLEGGKLFLSMEYLKGGDLEHRLARGIDESHALRVLREMASVLGFVHSKGIIHRDIKPANILFREDETLVLTDFGIAKKINNDVGMTQAGMIVGSAAYCSPEQLQGMEIDHRADIYSLGVLMLELFTGKNPFKADTFIDTAMHHMQMEVPRLPTRQARLQPLLNKMLAKKPRDRLASMDELVSFLDSINTTPMAAASKIASTSTPTQRETLLDTSLPADVGLDDFEKEALRLLSDSNSTLTNQKPLIDRRQPATIPNKTPPSKTPPPISTNKSKPPGSYVNVRTRPLPDNLFDD
ncbi:MAG TPA: serine/threonine-protein kinase [Pseudomonadales bacterium]|nr:serine/threonine-protein kinase [Pseudomonadales bacterium]